MRMGDKSSENYLDNLLGSISDMEPRKKKNDSDSEKVDFDAKKPQTMQSDDEFLKAFEAELESDSYKDYFADFERELEQEKGDELEIHTDKSGIPEDIGEILKEIEDNSVEAEAVPEMPEPTISSPEQILSEEGIVELSPMEAMMEDSGEEEFSGIQPVEELKMTDAGEVDLSGQGDGDLMDLLAGSEGLEDIGDILNPDAPLPEGTDEIEQFAQKEMGKQESAAGDGDEDEPDGGKKNKKKKRKTVDGDEKPSFGEKLKKLLFGEDEPEEDESSKRSGAAGLADENEEILKEMEQEEKAKAKKEKKKKEKKPKPKKEAKPKPKKPPKPKKEKPPKEKDNTPPLPKGPVILILVMVASLAFLVMLGTNLLNYSAAVSEAKSAYSSADYTEAFSKLQGESIRTKDEGLYNKLTVLAAVSSEYDAYLLFKDYGNEEIALDSLVSAAGRYDLNRESAAEYECTDELETLRDKIGASLEEYGMTVEEAVEMYNQRNRTEYSVLLYRKLTELGLE
jgi:hypothetical protein